LIGHHAASKLYVCGISITCDNLASLKINRLCNNSCEPYLFELEMKRSVTDFNKEPKMLFPCSYVLSKERNLMQTCSIHSPNFLYHRLELLGLTGSAI
jgi:hypothetical protein